jgi:protein PhnA
VASHVTRTVEASPGDPLPPAIHHARVVGHIDDPMGVEALVVALDGSTARPDGGTWHITWSLADDVQRATAMPPWHKARGNPATAAASTLSLPCGDAPRLAYPPPTCHGRPGIHRERTGRDMSDDEYVYDEDSGEWMTAAEQASRRAAENTIEVRDAVGNVLQDGDQVTLIKDLDVKGAGQTLKRGTLIKSIRLTGDAQEIDCKFDGIKGLVLRAEFVRKR